MPPVSPTSRSTKRRTATYFFLRGLAIVLPPIVTLLILLWLASGFYAYVIQPVNTVVRYAYATAIEDIRNPAELEEVAAPLFPELPGWRRSYRVLPEIGRQVRESGQPLTAAQLDSAEYADKVYVPMGGATPPTEYVPLTNYEWIFEHVRPEVPPKTAIGLYMEMARHSALTSQLTVLALLLVIVGLYFLGRFVTARIGSWIVHRIESVLTQLPLVRNVYSTVKQVTDFVLSDREVEFKRVVALEYPRTGSWTVGFVTGEGMLDCINAVGEPLLTVLVPTSPMPAGGFTIMIPRSQVIDLNVTVDQAAQFIFSCGVLTPPQQRPTSDRLDEDLRKTLAAEGLVTSAASGSVETGS
ncbi:MAG: DUF502 domain-containing protein [Planctomycetaceae bacterium]